MESCCKTIFSSPVEVRWGHIDGAAT